MRKVGSYVRRIQWQHVAPTLGTGIVTSNLPPKHANFFSYDAQAMEESRGSREALYLQGIFVDASVNNPRVRGDGIGRKTGSRSRHDKALRTKPTKITKANIRGTNHQAIMPIRLFAACFLSSPAPVSGGVSICDSPRQRAANE